jgi:hypothetical protein
VLAAAAAAALICGSPERNQGHRFFWMLTETDRQPERPSSVLDGHLLKLFALQNNIIINKFIYGKILFGIETYTASTYCIARDIDYMSIQSFRRRRRLSIYPLPRAALLRGKVPVTRTAGREELLLIRKFDPLIFHGKPYCVHTFP